MERVEHYFLDRIQWRPPRGGEPILLVIYDAMMLEDDDWPRVFPCLLASPTYMNKTKRREALDRMVDLAPAWSSTTPDLVHRISRETLQPPRYMLPVNDRFVTVNQQLLFPEVSAAQITGDDAWDALCEQLERLVDIRIDLGQHMVAHGRRQKAHAFGTYIKKRTTAKKRAHEPSSSPATPNAQTALRDEAMRQAKRARVD
jgi:hypothetical protein